MGTKRIYGDWTLILSLTHEEQLRLTDGKAVMRGSKVYALCPDCDSVVQVNKFLFGAMHLCKP
jgi:hypothetical protein